ncbi:unnamed protein product [Didymodactylos carnosus]|uniref:Glycosyltransferase n=1 Tax=Didymodactylos carnosus TaxID=1234261 RepID=A0A8S2DFK9_9BILA|nr:unnamed protein product [Didymodactylos carnosus]CAF3695058.1 unnamed protein product [Didymodactylos carnosus]
MYGSGRVLNKLTCIALTIIIISCYCLINLNSRIYTVPSIDYIINNGQFKNYAEISLPFDSLRNLTIYLRLYRDLKKLSKTDKNEFITKFERDTFPWLNGTSMSNFRGEKMSKGIVVCMSDKYMKVGLPVLLSLKDVKNNLPIEIMYYGENDLSVKNRQKLLQISNVIRLIDLSTIFYNVSLAGFAIKPFAILASTFQHVLLMNSDVYFLQSPAKLFVDNDYIQENVMLFTDRTMGKNKTRTTWVNSILPPPFSKTFNESRMVRGLSEHEIESGVVLINKGNDDVLLGLFVICILNVPPYSIYNYVHGDKETYWLGLEMIQKTFYLEQRTGCIGDLVNDDVCGHIIHGDKNEQPLWWNGALLQSKFSRLILLKFTHYAWERRDRYYLWKTPCINVNKTEHITLDQRQTKLIHMYKETLKNVCREMAAEGESCLP